MRSVYYAENLAEAYMVRDLLRDNGIEAEVANEILSQVRGDVPLDLSTIPTVWIADEDRAEEAFAILHEMKSAPIDPEWTCPTCREGVPGGFSACWNCGVERPSA